MENSEFQDQLNHWHIKQAQHPGSCILKKSNEPQPMTTATLTVKSNHVPRECTLGMYFIGCLRQELRAQFDYLTEDEFDYAEFFKYRGSWYSVADFMRLDCNSPFDSRKWDGYASDSYFSGVLVKYCYDGTVIVGTYFS